MSSQGQVLYLLDFCYSDLLILILSVLSLLALQEVERETSASQVNLEAFLLY